MMIAINLKPGLKRKGGGAASRALASASRALGSKVKDPLLVGVAASWLAVAVLAGRRLEEADVGARGVGAAPRAGPHGEPPVQGVHPAEEEAGAHPRLAAGPDRRDPRRGSRPLCVAARARRSGAGAAGLHLAHRGGGPGPGGAAGVRLRGDRQRPPAAAGVPASRAARWTSRRTRSSCGSSRRRRG